ncbi:hypothetical protein [Sphingopyxis fribergensis]|nr:hypothetical protein [Sphingopyxis fribergensis]
MDALLSLVSHRAVAAWLAIVRRFNGFNNGQIALSMRDLAEVIGSPSNPANADAIDELEAAGFIRATRFPKGQRKATEYELTHITTGRNGEIAATHDYLERLETKKSSVSHFHTRNPLRVSRFHTRRKHRVSCFDTGATETVGFDGHAPVSSFHTHIVSHISPQSDPVSDTPDIAPKSSRAISPLSAAMDLAELRSFARAYLDWASAGAQSKLAHHVEMPGGTLSKFLSGRSLPDQYRMPLQLAVARSFPMDARNAA